mmetsp:Transcript_40216/g.88298  ORF Transcript_40216/g.88298 Transcript_40216/m.88298 type:complete len:210 (-) Transcript_40216:1034-1663(-)
MHEIEVDVVELQVGERLAARHLDVLGRVVRIPQLGRDPQLLATHEALVDGAPDPLSHLRLVAVVAGAVEVPVAGTDGSDHRVGAHVARRLPQPKPDGGQPVVRLETQHRHTRATVGVRVAVAAAAGACAAAAPVVGRAPQRGEHAPRRRERLARVHHRRVVEEEDVALLPLECDARSVHHLGHVFERGDFVSRERRAVAQDDGLLRVVA